jgi:tetratricopeptide (TPR) repeat protein
MAIARGPAAPPSRRGPARWAITGAALACLVVGVLLLREPIGRWIFPDAALAGLIAQAEQALAVGDTATAKAGFLAAQARSPDHPRVLDGLARTRDGLLRTAERAAADGDPGAGLRAVEDALALGAPRERVEAVRHALLERSAPTTETLLQRAAAMESDDRDGALALYRQVLLRAPGDPVARAGRGRLLAATLADAARALDAGDFARAAALVGDVRRIDPAHLGLPEVEMRLGELGVRSPDPADGSTSSATVDRAGHADAARWLGLADEAIGRGALDEARRAMETARTLAPDAPELAALQTRIERAEAARVDPR